MTTCPKFEYFLLKRGLKYRILHFSSFVKKNCGGYCRRICAFLLLAEGLTVGALVHSGVLLVGTHQDAIQRAIVLGVAMVSALLYGALNTLVGMAIHGLFLLFLIYGLIVCTKEEIIHCFLQQNMICCLQTKSIFWRNISWPRSHLLF